MDILVDYLFHEIEELGICDLEPLIMNPTWRNNCIGYGGISKRLDRFLLDKEILAKAVRP